MDKVQALVWSLYTSGIRAYHRVDEQGRSVTYFQKSDGSRWPHEGAFVWDRMREYQEEQRNNGVPIRIRGYDAAEKWRDNHRKADVRPPFFFGCYAENPDLNEYSCNIPYIKHYASDGSYLGFFTNFRWRAGYPKGGQNAGV